MRSPPRLADVRQIAVALLASSLIACWNEVGEPSGHTRPLRFLKDPRSLPRDCVSLGDLRIEAGKQIDTRSGRPRGQESVFVRIRNQAWRVDATHVIFDIGLLRQEPKSILPLDVPAYSCGTDDPDA